MRIARLRLHVTALVLTCAVLALGTATAQGTLVVAHANNPEALDTLAPSNATISVMSQMFDGLTRRANDGAIVPALAESWEAVDETTWNFRIRDGVQFHNGEPLTAETVKFSIERALDPERPNVRGGRIALVTGVEVLDANTIQIRTSAPSPTLLWGLTQVMIVPMDLIAEVGEEAFTANPVGTGPFKLVEFVQGRSITLEANSDYWGDGPYVDRLVFRQIAEASARLAALVSGEVDIIENLPPDLVPVVEGNPNLSVASIGTEQMMVLQLDSLSDGPLSDVRVRQAIDFAIDKVEVTDTLLAGQGVAADGQVVTRDALGYNPDVSRRPYDPQRARELLAEAGYPEGFEFRVMTTEGRAMQDSTLAVALQGYLEAVGIRTSVLQLESGSWIDNIVNGTAGPSFLVTWYNFGDADLALTWFITGSRYSHYWRNEEFDRLATAAKSTIDRAERERLYHRALEIMHDEVPIVPIWQPPMIYGVSSRVSGWMPRPDEIWYLAETRVE